MKKLIIIPLAALLSFAGVSCSVQEDMTATEQENAVSTKEGDKIFNDAEFSKAFTEGLAEGLKDIKIDFATQFKYSDESELKSKSEKLYKFMLDEMPYEMTHVKDAAHMVVTINVANGRAFTKSIYLLNAGKDMIVQQMITNPDNEFDIAYNIPYHAIERNGYTLVKENTTPDDAEVLSAYLVDKISKLGGTGSFMVVSSADKVSLYLKS